jgi:hypothetical protein
MYIIPFFKEMQDGPKKIANAFRDIQGPLQLTNDALEITNARLENDIAKLEGKHENTLKVMLLDAQQAADKLAESLEKGLGSLGKLLKEQSVGWLKESFGQAGTGDLENIFNTLQSAVETVTDQFSAKIAKAVKAGDKGLVKSLTEEEASRISNLYTSAIEKVNAVQQTPPKLLPQSLLVGAPVFEDTTARDEAARRMQKYLQGQMEQSALETQHGELAGRKSGLEAGKGGRDKDQAELIRLTDELAKAQAARLTGLEKIDAEETAEIDHLNITPRNASTITPLSKVPGGGGGDTYHIDARGADLGAANRISRALEATHQSAVTTAVRANAQRSWRVPQRKG